MSVMSFPQMNIMFLFPWWMLSPLFHDKYYAKFYFLNTVSIPLNNSLAIFAWWLFCKTVRTDVWFVKITKFYHKVNFKTIYFHYLFDRRRKFGMWSMRHWRVSWESWLSCEQSTKPCRLRWLLYQCLLSLPLRKTRKKRRLESSWFSPKWLMLAISAWVCIVLGLWTRTWYIG